jgi:hypothetical protein
MNESNDAQDLVVVWEGWGETEAKLVKVLLEGHGIECMVQGESTALSLGFAIDGLAEVQVLVRPEDADRARDLITTPEEGQEAE